jgi:type II secretory pathway pseudopilin PulG
MLGCRLDILSAETAVHLRKPRDSSGFALLEAVVAMGIFAAVGLLLGISFSFSLLSQKEGKKELEAARSAGQILEILRSTSFDALNLIEDGGLTMDPLGKFQKLVLDDIQDRLSREQLAAYLTIRAYSGWAEAKQLHVTVASTGLSPHTAPNSVPPGQVLVKQSTIVTKRGINP